MKNKVIIIDDDQDFIDATKIFLEASGYEVLTANDGQEGFQKIKDEKPDLIILDMMMTYKTEGAETAKALASDAAVHDIPIIMITGARKEMGFDFDLVPDKGHLPVKMLLEKPVHPDRLIKLVELFVQKGGGEHRHLMVEVETLAEKWKGKQGNLIMILHEIQNHYGYVPRDISFELSRILDIPLARIYEVITFYNYFKIDPPGKHVISVCLGTACYLKGAPDVLRELKKILHVEEGQTTEDKLFHLQVVRCLGCCGLAPVLMIDQKIYGKVKKDDVSRLLTEYLKSVQSQEKVNIHESR